MRKVKHVFDFFFGTFFWTSLGRFDNNAKYLLCLKPLELRWRGPA